MVAPTRREQIDHLKWVLSRLESQPIDDVDDAGKIRHFANIVNIRDEIKRLEEY